MAFTSVPTVATGDVWSAANHNQYIKDNFAALWVGSAAGDIDYYSSATAKTRLAKPSVDSVLKNTSAGVPSWKAVLELLSVASRQGGSATDWNTAGTTTYTPTNQKVEIGVNTVVMSGTSPNASGYLDVTFPVAFSAKPFIIAGNMYAYSASNVFDSIGITNITTAGFRLWVNYSGNAVTYGNATIGWLAIGTP
jgi:hypothetical protein